MPPRTWNQHISRLLLAAICVLLLGWLSGNMGLLIILAISGWGIWQVFNQWRLYKWLHESELEPPDSFGFWSDVFDRISALQRNSRQYREQQAARIDEFMGITNAFPDASLIVDKNDTLIWFNDAAQELLHLKTSEDRGQSVVNLIRDPDFADWLAVQDRVSSKFELPCPTDQNVRLSATAIDYSEGQRLIVLRNITDIHNLEKIRRDFVANVSHELRTPLTVLLGYLESMQEDCPENLLPAINRMHSQAGQMHELIKDLLELSRLQSDEQVLDDGEIDIPAMLTQLRELADELSQGNLTVDFNIQTDLWLRGVPGDIESAFRNLIQNAVHYTPENGKVSVVWKSTEAGPEFVVSDNGPGIPSRAIPRLTERFYRVGTDRSRHRGGTGLGLSIVKHVLNAHQGKLHIVSALGEGSTFSCTFPAERQITKYPE